MDRSTSPTDRKTPTPKRALSPDQNENSSKRPRVDESDEHDDNNQLPVPVTVSGMDESALSEIVAQTARKTSASIKDFVTYSHGLIDQTLWERTRSVDVTKNKRGEEVVEASFLPLTRDFAAHTAIPTFMGSDFLTNFPDFFDDIWVLDRGFALLAAGLPRWLPIPSLTRAHNARRRMLNRIEDFHIAMEKRANGKDPGPDWTNLDDVGAMVKARVGVYREVAFSMKARAAIELSLLWYVARWLATLAASKTSADLFILVLPGLQTLIATCLFSGC